MRGIIFRTIYNISVVLFPSNDGKISNIHPKKIDKIPQKITFSYTLSKKPINSSILKNLNFYNKI